VVLDLLVDALETCVAELEQLLASFFVLHGLSPDVSLKRVDKELEADSVVVLHHLVVFLHVLCTGVPDDADRDQLPVLAQNVLSLSLVDNKESEHIDESHLVLVLSDLSKFDELINGFLWGSLEIEIVEPGNDVCGRFYFLLRLLGELSDEVLHLLDVGSALESDWHLVHGLVLLEF